MLECGGERTSSWDAAGRCFSSQETTERKEAGWRRKRFAVVFMCQSTESDDHYLCMKLVYLFAASDDSPPEQKNNLLLHKAIRALFARSPLFHTQTLTLDAHPIPDACCCSTENNAEEPATTLDHTDTAEDQESLSLLPPSRTKSRKRLREMKPARESKRRKSSSWSENVSCIHWTSFFPAF